VIRETIREAGLFNGSVGTVRAIDDATLHVERRDGKVVAVDTREHPGVQHRYCSTEYREQGSTRYAELQLVTEHVNARSLKVGMTRHTDEYGMFYSREAVGSYEDLIGLGLRTRSKELAGDYQVRERTREPQLVEITLGELREELRPIARGKAGYDFLERRGVQHSQRDRAFRYERTRAGLTRLARDAQARFSAACASERDHRARAGHGTLSTSSAGERTRARARKGALTWRPDRRTAQSLACHGSTNRSK